ncbi:ATP-binding protein [Rhizobium sp. AAP43]|uniref:ATP-binding protein n=1 Tax=Rhizobium sp. AAP43 TaxID=1523420 RepID=UPI0006B953FA|nr:ATP-binding protein [Rhizobium sp. AAP43]KPF41608.1 histidine kinase [Rhizobium sp. AAP43]
MPAQYPFIDVAVHDLIRPRLARGEALVLFASSLSRVVWCNGAGARFFGQSSIYDFLEEGPNRSDLSFRQIEAAARPLSKTGDSRGLMLRVNAGFRTVPVQATVERVDLRGEPLILLALPAAGPLGSASTRARELMAGFDDPDTHMAVIDGDGAIIAASPDFATLQITDETMRMLIGLVAADQQRLVKRPIPTGRGHLPAAIGKLSDDPAIHLLFTVDTHGDGAATAPVATPLGANLSPATTPLEVAELANNDLPGDEIASLATGSDQQPVSPPDDSVMDALGAIEEIDEIEPQDDDEEAFAQATETADLDLPSPEELDAGAFWTVEESAAEDDEGADTQSASAETPDMAEPDAEAETPVAIAEAAPVERPVAATARSVNTAGVVGDDFVFERDRRAIRFVWKIDESGRFSDVSPEFAQAVGPHASDINGVAFSDLAALFSLDPDGKIGELLKKRDTWSGKTIYWPVQGTSLMVPVDLAALPTYTRNRDFDGFRGFGIVRVADAVEDPTATGLTFVQTASDAADDEAALDDFLADLSKDERHAPEEVSAEEEEEAAEALDRLWSVEADDDEDEEQADEGLSAAKPTGEDRSSGVADLDTAEDHTSTAADEEDSSTSDEDMRFEPPVLRIMETRAEPTFDKVVKLEERRRGKNALSPGEQAAFREIARKLDPIGLRAHVEESLSPSPAEPPALRGHKDAGIAPVTERSPLPVSEPDLANEAEAETETEVGEDTRDTVQAMSAEATSIDAPDVAEDAATAADAPPMEHDVGLLPARRERSLTADVVDLMPVPLLVHVGDRLIHANPEFFSLTGYTSLADLEAAGGLDALIARQDLDEPGDGAGAMTAIRADGTVVPVSARLQSVRFDEASALMLALIAQSAANPDTPRAAAPIQPAAQATIPASAQPGEVARLKVEVEELRAILETATDGVVILDSDGDIRSMNRAASALFNFDDMETRGKPFVMLFAHESQKSILDYLNGLSGHGVASVLNDGREVIGREASGGFLPLFMTIGTLNSSNGYCAVIRDITQWKRTEDELRNAKRAAETANAHKTDFLARVSHEIRTPLNAIIGFADMMANEHFGPVGHPRYGEYAHDIVRSGRHVLDIVNDLLDISKIEAGEMELDFSSVGLNETVQAAVSIVQPQANSQRVIIRTALSQAVPSVVADDRSIKQIVLNILANAIRFTPSGGQIIVSTAYEPNGNVVLRIRDTGIGMSRGELEQAMKPFRQVSTGTPRNRGDGTGLGLPLTKAMVDANRAQFAISSTPNEGTLVEITFPSPRVLAD